MKKLSVLISNAGTGSNLQAIIDAIKNHTLKAEIVIVISDKDDAKGLDRASENKIPTEICPKKEDLLQMLQKYQPDYICLAGWKQIITDDVLEAYKNKILNIHPGLIPDTMNGFVKNPDGTKGLWNRKMFMNFAIANFLNSGATYAGSTVHFLTNEFDFGPVLARTFEKIRQDDTVETLYKRLKQKENNIYVEALKKVCNSSPNPLPQGEGIKG